MLLPYLYGTTQFTDRLVGCRTGEHAMSLKIVAAETVIEQCRAALEDCEKTAVAKL